MSRSRLSSLLLVVSLGLAALGALSATPGDEKEVRAFVVELADGWSRARTADEITAFFSSDASHIDPAGACSKGRAALDRYFAPIVSRRSADFAAAFDVEHVSFISERVALVDGSIRSRGASGNATVDEIVERFAFVTRRAGDGWKIVASRMTLVRSR